MEIVPSAVGQSDGVIVFWDDNPEIGVAWPRPLQVIDEIEWGIGALNEIDCLVLYMFAQGQSIELYLTEELPTSPTAKLEVWALVCDWNPSVLKIRFGATPGDRQHEVTFLLPQGEGEGLVEKLNAFRKKTLGVESDHHGNVPESHLALFRRLDEYLNQPASDSR